VRRPQALEPVGRAGQLPRRLDVHIGPMDGRVRFRIDGANGHGRDCRLRRVSGGRTAVGAAGGPAAPGPGPDAVAGDDVVRVGRAGVAWRTALVAVLAALFLAGTLVGDDHWWPFGPWRMFSTSQAPTGAVVYMSIEVRSDTSADRVPGETDDWRPAPITLESVGLNRAEVEGRIPRIVADPDLLGTLARSHARLRPQDAPWTGVRLVRNAAVIVDRRPTGETRRTVLATWEAS